MFAEVPVALIVALWVVVLAVTVWWLRAHQTPVTPAPPTGDPHAGEIARFRTELHDWDRQ